MTHWKSPWCCEKLRAEEKRASEEERAGWHYWCNGHELGQTSGEGKGKGGLAYCSPWVAKSQTPLGDCKTTKYFPLSFLFEFINNYFWKTRKSIIDSSIFSREETHTYQTNYIPTFKNEQIWRWKWQPTPVFLPGKAHGKRSLVGYSPWGYITEHLCMRGQGDGLVAINW